MPQWKDTTSYHKGERSAPREWTPQAGGMRITLHRFSGADPTIWFGTVHNGPPISRVQLENSLAEDAMVELRALVRRTLEGMLKALESA